MTSVVRSLQPTADLLTQLQSRVDTIATAAPDFYAATHAAQIELGDLRGTLAMFMADDHDETVSDNTKGFAQNVAHAIEGLDRILGEAGKSALAVMAARRSFADQVKAWQDSAAKDAAAALSP